MGRSDRHANDLFAVSVSRAVLIDSLPEAATIAGDGERVLLLVLTVENLWTKTMYAESELRKGIVPLDADQTPITDISPAFARLDDATISPALQPNVPAEIVMSWAAPAHRYVAGDEVQIELRDPTLFTFEVIASSSDWTDYEPSARLSLTIEDVGAGAQS